MAENYIVDACWKHIGVWSREGASCKKLDDIIHCRNCDVYMAAGRRILDIEVSLDARHIMQLTKRYAELQQTRTKGGEAIMIFRLGGEWLALETKYISKVLDPQTVCRIPHRVGKLLKGIANIDGAAKVVVSVGALLGIDSRGDYKAANKRHRSYPRMMVIGDSDGEIAMPVDEVFGRHVYLDSELQQAPETIGRSIQNYTRGIINTENKIVGILDGNLLLYGIGQALN